MFNLTTVRCAPGVMFVLDDRADTTGTLAAPAVPDPETMTLTS